MLEAIRTTAAGNGPPLRPPLVKAAKEAFDHLLDAAHPLLGSARSGISLAPVLTPTHTEWPPLGPDNGKVVYFMRYAGDRLRHRAADWIDGEQRWQEEIQQARAKGYTVVVDPVTTRADLLQALYDQRTAGIIFNGHGGLGYAGLKGPTADFDKFFADQVDPSKVSSQLKMMVFQTCRTVSTQDAWQRVLKGAAVVGWEDYVSLAKVAAANDPQILDKWGPIGRPLATHPDHLEKRLDHLIDRYL